MKKLKVVSHVLLVMIVLLSVALTVHYDLPVLDLVVGTTGVIYMASLSGRSIFNFLFGMVNVILYIILSYNSKLYGEAILYLLFDIPVSIIAFFAWKRVVRKDFTVPTKKLHAVWLLILPIVLASFAYFYGLFLRFIGGEYVFVDALSTGVTIIATILLWKRYREQWYGWILVYAISIIMWMMAGSALMVVASAGCLIFSVIGLFEWRYYRRRRK